MSNSGCSGELFPQSARAPLIGILPSQIIRELVDAGKVISPAPIPDGQIQPASLDLRLGRTAYQVRASFVPGRATIRQKISDLLLREIDLENKAVLTPGAVYIVPLLESLRLPADIYAKANPKSTTGRLDIFTRLLTEPGEEFEMVPKGYSGALYLEVVSRTFAVAVKTGMKLNQLRFIRGQSGVSDRKLSRLAETERLVYEDAQNPLQPEIERGLRVAVDLESRGDEIIAYKARRDVTQTVDLERVNHYRIADFWETIRGPRSGLILDDPRDFYILASWERISVPPSHAAEMVPFDPSIGEFRIHYAGFFDPGFGHGVSGTKAVLEVRAHDVPMLLEDRQLVGKLIYHKMAKTPDKIYGPAIGSSYQQQALALSKQFRRERHDPRPAAPAPLLAPPELAPR